MGGVKLNGWSLVAAFVTGFFLAITVDDWLLHRHPEWFR